MGAELAIVTAVALLASFMRCRFAVLIAALIGGCRGDSTDPPPIGETSGLDLDPAYCDMTLSWDQPAVSLESQLLSQINGARTSGTTCTPGTMLTAEALETADELTCAARVHALDMVARGFVDHTNPDGETAFDRIANTGYVYAYASENIATGRGTAAETLEQWRASPPHCETLLDARYTQVGIGYVAGGPELHVWTVVLAAPSASD